MSEKTYLLGEADIDAALAQAEPLDISLLIIDSVQAVYSSELSSAPGSVSQVRLVAAKCLAFAREKGCAVILVGHVTKEGVLAGPRVLEHMVDTVLYFEGERYSAFRLLRAVKNRFGSTNEIGLFEMTEKGLQPLLSPSAHFFAQRQQALPGAAVTAVMQGTRPLLLEVQALVSPSAFGNPRRLANGLDYNRFLLIIAVLERKLGLPLGNKDIYLNIAGGLRVDDTAADLACAAAVVSALKDQPLEEGLLLLGEMGLLGELRSVPQLPRRLREAAAFQFRLAVAAAPAEVKNSPLRLLPVHHLTEAMQLLGLV